MVACSPGVLVGWNCGEIICRGRSIGASLFPPCHSLSREKDGPWEVGALRDSDSSARRGYFALAVAVTRLRHQGDRDTYQTSVDPCGSPVDGGMHPGIASPVDATTQAQHLPTLDHCLEGS